MTKSIFTNKHKDCKTIFHLHIFAAAMLAMLLMMPSGTEAQELIESPNDPTFVTEYRNNSQFGVSAKNRLVVSLGNKFVKTSMGNSTSCRLSFRIFRRTRILSTPTLSVRMP